MIIRVVSSRLTGMERKWYDSQEYLNANWKSIKRNLVKQFAKPRPFAKLLKEAVLYETREGQDLGEYCVTKLDKLCYNCEGPHLVRDRPKPKVECQLLSSVRTCKAKQEAVLVERDSTTTINQ
ncbi:hypothetical protein MTP99_014374 [Tenebrio molitor]|nr:hypothetical protein MTP99_014374 [Tenebrio molitor]